MSCHYLAWLLIPMTVGLSVEWCPNMCTCESASLFELPINAVLVQAQRRAPDEDQLPSYQHRNEVLDETDEHRAQHQLGQGKLSAATCVLQPTDNLRLFLSLPQDLQVLTLLQGPGTENITLDESCFQHLQKLVVLEIHGFPHGHKALQLRNNALKDLESLQYLNLQHLHLLGEGHLGNRPAPLSAAPYTRRSIDLEDDIESNNVQDAIQLMPLEGELDIVPYSVYRDQQERAGLSIFAGLGNLVFLRAFHCNIKEVYWEMFDGLERLEYLSLEGNKIPFLHEFAFYGAPNLKQLIMSHNKLLHVQSTCLAGLFYLQVLDFSFNNISHLSELSLPPLPELITADFHHNPLELILPYTFQIMNNTENLFLGGKNARLVIHPNSFLGLNKVRKLSLNSIYLDVLEREYLKGMPRLRELKMEGTIYELAFDAFLEVPKVQELILKYCSIRKISMDAFFGLYGLMYLDLSYNELEMLPPSLFEQQNSLKEINLSNNKLTTLPEGLFKGIPAKLIRLDKNPWHCTCAMHDWQPSQINKVKVKTANDSLCQGRYDKRSMCQIHYSYRYIYEQSVSPRCTTPVRFSGWSVFHLLRKHLRCHEKRHQHKLQWYHHQKEHAHPRITETNHKPTLLTKSTSHNVVTITPKEQINFTSKLKLSTLSPTKVESDTGRSGQIVDLSVESTTVFSSSINDLSSTQTANKINNELNSLNADDINQHLWTKKDKDKYKLLQQKQDRIFKKLNVTIANEHDKSVPTNLKINVEATSKTKKRLETLKKWETKMENTMQHRNSVPDSVFQAP